MTFITRLFDQSLSDSFMDDLSAKFVFFSITFNSFSLTFCLCLWFINEQIILTNDRNWKRISCSS